MLPPAFTELHRTYFKFVYTFWNKIRRAYLCHDKVISYCGKFGGEIDITRTLLTAKLTAEYGYDYLLRNRLDFFFARLLLFNEGIPGPVDTPVGSEGAVL